jgi:hypothetical protein
MSHISAFQMFMHHSHHKLQSNDQNATYPACQILIKIKPRTYKINERPSVFDQFQV